MSTEQQARLRFLEEAETYFEQIETVILNLNESEQRTQDLDVAMRAAHSVKGTAAMMDYMVLSHVAHKMEDYFKILRARNLSLEIGVETLMLAGLDSLRVVRERFYNNQPVDSKWQSIHVDPIFVQLQHHLGELTPEDEERILSADEDVDVSVMVFTNGVDEYLETLDGQRSDLTAEELRQELITGAGHLLEYGLMAELDAFVQLCEGVIGYSHQVVEAEVDSFATQVLQTWKRSLSLVQLGRREQLPTTLPNVEAIASLQASSDQTPIEPDDSPGLTDTMSTEGIEVPTEVTSMGIDETLGGVADVDTDLGAVDTAADVDLDAIALDASELEALQAAVEAAVAFDIEEEDSLTAPQSESPSTMEQDTTAGTEELPDATLDQLTMETTTVADDSLLVSEADISQLQAELAQIDLAGFGVAEGPVMDLAESVERSPEDLLQDALEEAALEVDTPEHYQIEPSLELDGEETKAVAIDGIAIDGIAPSEIAPDETTSDGINPNEITADEIASALSASAEDLDNAEAPDTAQAVTDSSSDTPADGQAFSSSDLKLLAAGVAASRSASIPKSKQSVAKRPANETTVRVPVEQLRMINQLIGTLMLDRNAIALQLEQLQDFSALLRQRVSTIDAFNTNLRQWYDQTSTQGLGGPGGNMSAIPVLSDLQASGLIPSGTSGASVGVLASSKVGTTESESPQAQTGFDALEMDQYSSLHLLVQENIETIVKLQEVAADIELGIQSMGQATRRLNFTGQSLEEQINQAQMRPFEDIVSRFPRVIRDLSANHGKKVNLVIEGESTLFERYTLEILMDPLLHLLRNAFDHGIEEPGTRQAKGKPVEGTIRLKAMSRGNRAIITLSDDGNGIDLTKIRDRVRAYGIPDAQINQMTRQELQNLIFEPGFTTTDKVTDLSGRGIGMDVVRANLRDVKGEIQVDTEPGKGTTFTITIPLALSLLRVMFVEHNNFVFAVSAEEISTMTVFDPEQVTNVQDQEHIPWNGTTIPLIRLDHHWSFASRVKTTGINGKPMINRPVVLVVGDADNRYGLLLKRFWREQDVLIRAIASPLHLPQGFGGTTVLGDGRVVPLLDPVQLREWVMDDANAMIEDVDQLDVSDADSRLPASVKVLVVDDSIHARQYLAISLEKEGYSVEQAKDGSEAIDMLTGGLKVNAIICDVEMPRVDGYGVLDTLRSQPDYQTLPIMMLTSRSSEKHRKLAMNLGASAYFSKPYNEQELLQTLADLVN